MVRLYDFTPSYFHWLVRVVLSGINMSGIDLPSLGIGSLLPVT